LLVDVVLEGFAAGGSGDVLVVQKMLQQLAAAVAVDKEVAGDTAATPPTSATWQSLKGPFALMCIAMATTGESLGEDMAQRLFEHAHQFSSSPAVKRAIPLAVALLSLSDPRPAVVDTLTKFAHDADVGVGLSGVIGLGLIGFGSNNARIAGVLRQQAAFFAKEPEMLFAVRLAQGLVNAGKGLVRLGLTSSDGWACGKVELAGVAVFMSWLLSLGVESSVVGVSGAPYMWYLLTLAVRPRSLVTVNAETLEPVSVTVRVGQALDVVGQAGKQAKTITGFQTHTSPVLVGPCERAELATEEWTTLTPILEGVVLVKETLVISS
jgi:26S proteasome regulatory subunit N1